MKIKNKLIRYCAMITILAWLFPTMAYADSTANANITSNNASIADDSTATDNVTADDAATANSTQADATNGTIEVTIKCYPEDDLAKSATSIHYSVFSADTLQMIKSNYLYSTDAYKETIDVPANTKIKVYVDDYTDAQSQQSYTSFSYTPNTFAVDDADNYYDFLYGTSQYIQNNKNKLAEYKDIQAAKKDADKVYNKVNHIKNTKPVALKHKKKSIVSYYHAIPLIILIFGICIFCRHKRRKNLFS